MKLSRRGLLAGTAVIGTGVVIGVAMRGGPGPAPIAPVEGALVPNAFLQISPDNVVRFFCPRDEMGQGVTTGLATLIGEELDIDPGDIVVEWAAPHPDYVNPDFGFQGTGGSTSMHAHYLPLRQAGADARAALLGAAAAQLGVPANRLSTDNGAVVLDGVRHRYGEFAERAAGMELPSDTPLKPAASFKYIGKELPRIDSIAKATGEAVFGIDVDLPDLHHAVVKRCPVAGGTLASFDDSAARVMPGVIAVLPVETGVAVVARQYWQAHQAAAQLTVKWDYPELAKLSSADIHAAYSRAITSEDGITGHERGDVAQGFAAAAHVQDAQYWAPFLAHAPMEPMNAVVHIHNGEADVWSGTQGIGVAQGLVARFAGLSTDKVRAHSTYLGGGFGRRATLSHVIEATQAALATGKPVQVIWSREDDLQNGIYRPASLMAVKAGVDADGRITAWQAGRAGGVMIPDTLRNVMPGILPTAVPLGTINWLARRADNVLEGWVAEGTSLEGLFEDYDFPNGKVVHHTVNHGIPVTFWRSVGHSVTAFAKESMVDELAAAGGHDVVDLRLRNTADNPRLRGVIEVAGQHMRRMHPGPGRALGLAAHSSFGSYVAEVAEVSVDAGVIRVHNVLCVVDCGIAVNPDVVRAQMEGGVMFGLTAALHGNMEIKNGAFVESNFHNYPILRMNEAPAVQVVIVDSTEPPSGVGEPGVPPIAPAVANAVFAATGQRLRSLPLRLA